MSGQERKSFSTPATQRENLIVEDSLIAGGAIDYSEKTIYDLQNKFKTNIEKGDTIKAISFLSSIGTIYSNRGNYPKAYEQLWNALILSDKIRDSVSLANVYGEFGWLYSYYNRGDKALEYFNKSLNLNKRLIKQNLIDSTSIGSNYYSLTTFYREQNKFGLCKQYLDSCYMVHYTLHGDNVQSLFLDAEKSYYLLNTGRTDQAITLMNDIYSGFESFNPNYLTLLCSFMGDAYMSLKKFDLSEMHYKRSIDISNKLQSHSNYTPNVYTKLSLLYVQQSDYVNAYLALKKAKELNELMYDSRSSINRPLLEITDKFSNAKELQKQIIQEKRLAQLEHDDKVSLLYNIILIGVLVIILGFSFFYIRYLKLKHKSEQEVKLKKRKLEYEKNRELLELKNKELASSALRLIEKDKLLQELKEKLTDKHLKPSDPEIKKIFKSISASRISGWEEFDARFVEVNTSFYKKLNELFPGLTPGDRKLCALIKLNFSSKDIARLMSIGVDSVHTLRYRLRKKIGLNRSDNLTNYLESIEEE